MKRYGGLYDKICSIENMVLADELAGKGKLKRREIRRHRCRQAVNLAELSETLRRKAYKTSEYKHFKVYEPKERDIAKLPYYPDLIAHHAIMNVLEAILVPTFTADTYSGIKRRGIHKAAKALKRALKDRPGTTYCLKLDISKFYPNINHAVLKGLLRRKLKDNDLLWLLDEIIDSHPGLPIGNYLSIYLANLYLTGFDHWIKEVKGVKYYFRYADDMVILSGDKAFLHQLRKDIQKYLSEHLRLNLKSNWQVFPVAARGIDVIGYVFYHTHVLLRKSIKQRCCRTLKKKNRKHSSLAAHAGWMKHCNSRHLQKKLLIHEELQRLRNTQRASRTDGNRLGQADYRYRWPQMLRICDEMRPSWIVNENVVGSISNLVLDQKISDLERIGYSCQAYSIPAVAVGAAHERARIFLVANSYVQGRRELLYPDIETLFKPHQQAIALGAQGNSFLQFEERHAEPAIFPFPHGIPNHIFRLGAAGNSIVSPIPIILLACIKEIDSKYSQ